MDKLINEIFANNYIIVWTLITFGILLFVLGKFGWPAILAALEARENGIRDDIDTARRQREEAESLLNEHKKLMAEADEKVRALVDEAKRDAQVLQSEMQKKTQEESQVIRERALRDIELAKNAAIGSLREESVNLSVLMASKILSREVKAEDHKQLIDDCLKDVAGER
jgi:F-type H+-transporting ATPase subunit b